MLGRRNEKNIAIENIFEKYGGIAHAIQTSEIIKEGNYNGIRIKVWTFLGRMKQNMQWKAFLTKSKLKALTFQEVHQYLVRHLKPIYERINEN